LLDQIRDSDNGSGCGFSQSVSITALKVSSTSR
jgi:hypothetical protein